MKKLLGIILLLAVFMQESQAKIQAGIGIKVGPNFGRMNNEFLKGKLSSAGGTLNFTPGVHAGIQGRIWFNKFIGINLAAEFNMGGSTYIKYSGQGNVNIDKTVHKENQLTVPLTAMVGWGNERLRIFGNVGGYFGYNINGKDRRVITVNGSERPSQSVKADYDEVYQSIDAGLRMGAGVQVYVDKKLKSCVTFDLNYDFGFIEAYRDGAPDYFNNAEKLKLTNSKLNIGVGYIYTFGKSQAEERPKSRIQ
jgi:hypothetical protein